MKSIYSLLAILMSFHAIAGKPTITTLVFAQNNEAKSQIANLSNELEKVISTTPGKQWVPLQKVLGDQNYDKLNANLNRADRLLKAAIRNYNLIDLSGAATKFQDAIKLYESAASIMPSLKPLAESYLYLGATHFLQHKKNLAKNDFIMALRYDKHIEKHAIKLIASQKKMFDAAKLSLKKKPEYDLNLKGSPNFSALFVDGGFVGKIPSSKKYKLGRHILRATHPGYIAQAKLFSISQSNKDISVNLLPAPQAEKLANIAQTLAINVENPLNNPAEQLHVDEALWLAARLNGDALTLFLGLSKAKERSPDSVFRVFLITNPDFENELALWVDKQLTAFDNQAPENSEINPYQLTNTELPEKL